ncbi:MAG: RIP metalloprotease RseP [Desulfovibrio sp.]|jgi:regulator of sigma E protease|nr:RIP metalloprotease RseP [Desulfovibrio sp.]
MTTVLAVIIVLGGLIFFHELGHFVVARGFGMGVSVFSLGFGPKILKFKGGKTEYALSLVPLGGYVSLVGEDGDNEEIPEGFTPEESFSLRPAWQRLLVAASGPLANMLLAWLLCWALAFGWGAAAMLPEVGAVNEKSPAEAAGLKAGDRIVSVNGGSVESWDALAEAINGSGGSPLLLEIARPASPGAGTDFTTLNVVVQPSQSVRKSIFGEEESAWLIGVRATGKAVVRPLDFRSAALEGANQAGRMISLTWRSFVKLAQRVVPLDQVGGPIMIMQLVSAQADEGLAGLLALTALISVNLGILNLLPIPVLDGGQIVFCLWETIFRRPLGKKVQGCAVRVGLALLVCLMLLATFNDIWRLVKGAG